MTARFKDHILGPDTHVNLPDPATVPEAAIYECTTHGKIYKNVSATWIDYGVLIPPGGTTGQALVKNSGTDGDVGWGSGGGGGGGGWDHTITLPLSTLTGWTVGSGTWAISGGVINQSNTATPQRRLHLDTKIPLAQVVAQVEIKVNTATSTTTSRGGIVFGTPATADGGHGDGIFYQTNGSTSQLAAIHTERDTDANWVDVNLAATIATGTWTTLRVLKSGRDFTIWVDGSLLTTIEGTATATALGRFALYSYSADVSFRNLDIWTPAMPA